MKVAAMVAPTPVTPYATHYAVIPAIQLATMIAMLPAEMDAIAVAEHLAHLIVQVIATPSVLGLL